MARSGNKVAKPPATSTAASKGRKSKSGSKSLTERVSGDPGRLAQLCEIGRESVLAGLVAEGPWVGAESEVEQASAGDVDMGGRQEASQEIGIEGKEQHFRLMDLPAELRLEIYRVCLTRPWRIVLAKSGKAKVEGDDGSQNIGQQSSISQTVTAVASVGSRPLVHPATVVKPQHELDDPLLVALLRVSKQVHEEARYMLYSDNVFDINLYATRATIDRLHQRNRSQIKHVETTIQCYTDILERFGEVVRLALRYCSGLKKFVIHTPCSIPPTSRPGVNAGTDRNIYANGFDILRWLPQSCQVVLTGTPHEDVRAVVDRHMAFARSHDKVAYALRQIGAPVSPNFGSAAATCRDL